jgi:hypothetical protein
MAFACMFARAFAVSLVRRCWWRKTAAADAVRTENPDNHNNNVTVFLFLVPLPARPPDPITMAVVTQMSLYLTGERILLHSVPDSGPGPGEVVVIDRLTSETSVVPFDASLITGSATSQQVHGVIGTINLIAGPYLIVVTACTKVGEISGHSIFRIDSSDLIPHSKTLRHLTDEQVGFNNTYLSMVKSVLSTPHFYYSPSYDLSHTCQRLATASLSGSLDRADSRFVWNKSLLSEWNTRSELKKYCLPVVHGFISVKEVWLNQQSVRWTIVSRRHVKRAGCRLFMRGSDMDGNPANYVETEQIIEYLDRSSGKGLLSFVQIRGSIPLLWNQTPNLKYKPHPIPVPNVPLTTQADVLKRHTDSVTSMYGPVVMVSLINHTGAEGRMENAFGSAVSLANDPHVKYVSFDFHHECRKMRWDRLSILMDRLANDQQNMGYFHSLTDADGKVKVLSLQKGIFRTNCIDSLDRTNVLQGLIAKKTLEQQLQAIGLVSSGATINNFPEFENIYRNGESDFCLILIACSYLILFFHSNSKSGPTMRTSFRSSTREQEP